MMLQKVIDKWKDCKPGSFWSVLLETVKRWRKKATKEAKAKFHETGVWQRGWAEKEAKRTETFLPNCQCCLGEVKFPIHEVPVKTLTSPETHCAEFRDNTSKPKTIQTQCARPRDKTISPKATEIAPAPTTSPPPFAEARAMLEAIQHQMPQSEPTSSKTTSTPPNTTSAMAEVELPTSVVLSDTFEPPTEQSRSDATPSEHEYVNSPGAAGGDTTVHGAPSAVERRGLRDGRVSVDSSRHPHRHDHGNINTCSDTHRRHHQMPLVTATTTGGRASTSYSPFSLLDTTLIKTKLPDINKGGAPWIKAFLEVCAGVVPALGDFRRVFATCTSLGMLREIEQHCLTDADPDDVPLSHLVHSLWPAIREKFPVQMRSAELSRIPPDEDEKGAAYLLRVREMWQDRTGEDPVDNETLELLFRGAVEASVPPSTQAALKKVVGLPVINYHMWAAHVTQYLDNELEQRIQEKKDLFSLKTQLVKSQLREIRDKEKQNKASVKQLLQQAPPQVPPLVQPPPQVPYSPYPELTPYPHSQAVKQNRPCWFKNVWRGKLYDHKPKSRPSRDDTCYTCRGYRHWAARCPTYSHPPDFRVPQYAYDIYPPPQHGSTMPCMNQIRLP
ncbi:uncharacterized protein LOC115376851 [Myripristis murdjan]|uniref:uncharacterized protein LOC115376851 n=1 Tax=Myripristis murdjan TaxID=586833 RepID=UPI001176244D|nr:uncharacterized protein LOC115376851 [Myripristis murdjan]